MTVTTDSSSPVSVAAAIGIVVRRLRRENSISRDSLARAGAQFGVGWGITTIENIEAGRFAPTIPTLYVLCRALTYLSRDQTFGLLDLLPTEGDLEVATGFVVPAARLRRFLGDTNVLESLDDGLDEHLRMLGGPKTPPSLAESRAAKKLGIDVSTLQRLARDRFTGDTLDQVVSQSAGPGASPQARGHETRYYVQELANHIDYLKRTDQWDKWVGDQHG
ncbi:helix-turn-helix transcriptional regulator [Compostimonas suwonensis]|uniref:helix-turn-helix transcriptional regulator n=1 Tax=Compostimonas suwonensis TaxID=1048394 RepID=UPI0012FD7869|nr:helix-turn-helix transcriptional regulator [Compostimonas suwonensis]